MAFCQENSLQHCSSSKSLETTFKTIGKRPLNKVWHIQYKGIPLERVGEINRHLYSTDLRSIMNFKTQSAEQYYSMSHTVCTVKVLYIPVCLHVERISPESLKKLMRGNKNQSMKRRNAAGTDFPPHTLQRFWMSPRWVCCLFSVNAMLSGTIVSHVFALLSATARLNSSKTQWFPRAPSTEQVLNIFLLVYRLETQGKEIISFKTKIPAQTGSLLHPTQVQRVFQEGGQCEAVNFTTMGLLFNTSNSTPEKPKVEIAGLTFVMFHLCRAKFHLH